MWRCSPCSCIFYNPRLSPLPVLHLSTLPSLLAKRKSTCQYGTTPVAACGRTGDSYVFIMIALKTFSQILVGKSTSATVVRVIIKTKMRMMMIIIVMIVNPRTPNDYGEFISTASSCGPRGIEDSELFSGESPSQEKNKKALLIQKPWIR